MRRHSRPGRRRRALTGLTAAGLLASLTTGIAQADETQDSGTTEPTVVNIMGPDHYDLSPGQGFPLEGEPSFEVWAQSLQPSETDEDGNALPVHDGEYTVTIDATDLDGVADVELPCEAEGMVAVCTDDDINGENGYNERWDIRLAAGDIGQAGDMGTIVVTGEGEGLEFTSHEIDVLVGGPEFRERKLSEPEGFAAGDVFHAPLAFRNVGTMAADGVALRFHGSRGLSFPQKFSNCSYGVENEDDLTFMRRTAVCTFEGTFEAGATYQVATPVQVKTADFALRDIFGYHFTALDAAHAAKLHSEGTHRKGDGKELTLKQVSGGGTFAEWSELDFPTNNIYDLDLTGDRADGAEGETVTVDLALHNYGPAWRAHLRSGGEPVSFTVDVPEGATATRVPDNCSVRDVNDPKAGYLCFADTPVMEQDKREYRFDLRIDKVVEGAKGLIAFPDFDDPNEGDPANDDGWIVLNGTGDEETPGDTGGSDGTGGDTDGSDGASGGDDGDDGATANGGSGGDAGDQGTDTDGGSLALTGTGAMTLGGVALALLAAGGALLVVRRRRAATVTDTDDAVA